MTRRILGRSERVPTRAEVNSGLKRQLGLKGSVGHCSSGRVGFSVVRCVWDRDLAAVSEHAPTNEARGSQNTCAEEEQRRRLRNRRRWWWSGISLQEGIRTGAERESDSRHCRIGGNAVDQKIECAGVLNLRVASGDGGVCVGVGAGADD